MLRSRSRVNGGGSAWYKSAQYLLNNVLPTLVYDFAAGRYYASGAGPTSIPFTPTRTTNATMINNVGNMVWAPANLNAYTESYGGTGWSANGTPTATASTDAPPGFSASVQLDATTAGHGYYGAAGINRNLVSGATYTISAWVKSISGALSISFLGGANSVSVPITTSWTRVSGNVTSTSTIPAVYANGASTLLIAGIQIELAATDTPKAYISTAGTAYYGHRFDYNPLTLAARGILCEPAATNLAAQSRNSVYVGDTGFGTSSAAPTEILGFGGTRFTGDGSVNQHYIFGGATAAAPAASTVHTLSAYVRAGSVSIVQLTASSGFAAADVYANFDLSAGTVGSSGAGASNVTIINCGGGVYRIALTFTTIGVPAAGAACIVALISATTDTRLPAFASSGTIDVMGLQLETGVSYTSLIPTYGVAASRTVETFNSAIGISGWFNNTKGVMYGVYETYALANRNEHFFVIAHTNYTTNNSLAFISGFGTPTARRFDATVAGVTGSSSVSSDTLGAPKKIAGRYTSGTTTVKAFQNGTAYLINAAAAIPTPLDRFYLSQSGVAGESGIWIKEIRYYPDDSASDAQMITLTT